MSSYINIKIHVNNEMHYQELSSRGKKVTTCNVNVMTAQTKPRAQELCTLPRTVTKSDLLL